MIRHIQGFSLQMANYYSSPYGKLIALSVVSLPAEVIQLEGAQVKSEQATFCVTAQFLALLYRYYGIWATVKLRTIGTEPAYPEIFEQSG